MRIVSSLSAGFLALLTFALTDGAQATSLKTIYKFCSQRNYKDGRMPTGAVTRDAQGNFYAVTTTVDGGAFEGTIDELIPGDKHYKAKILHNYNDFPASGPNAGVILDVNGNVYGTTADVVYELVPNADRSKWKYKVIYTYCPDGDCSGGGQPSGGLSYPGAASGLPYDGVSPLYGTALVGGTGNGVVYQLVPNGDHWDESVVYSFCQRAKCADGSEPNGGVYVAGDGSLYGVTNRGGNDVADCSLGCGVVFQLMPGAPRGRRDAQWTDATLYKFCPVSGCADGKEPQFPPAMDAQGNLIDAVKTFSSGTVFKLTPNGQHWTYTTLTSSIGIPTSGVTIDGAGALYGEMSAFPGQGAVYRWDGAVLTTLHTFCLKDSCKDGAQPLGGLLLDASGSLFGITGSGANLGGSGTLFELTP